MKETELWRRLEHHLGLAYSRVWAAEHNVPGLSGATVVQSLAAGTAAKDIWRAVWKELGLPDRDR